jgi:cell volume regulation protein A
VDADSLDTMLLAGSAILLLAILAVRASVRVGMPSLLMYLAIGVLLGESVLGIHFDDAETAHALGFAALVVILTDGGLTTRWREVRSSVALGVVLATVGVAVSAGLVAIAAHLVLGLSWKLSLLLGAVTSPTDAAAVFTVLRSVPLRPSLLGALEAESGFNDAAAVLLVVALSGDHGVEGGVVGFAALVVYELVGGAALGLGVGVGGAWLMRRLALPASGLYPVTAIGICVLSYSGAATLHASGFAAVYVTALCLGNAELPHGTSTRSFAEGLAWLAQIGLFIMLGLLLSPGTVDVGDVVGGVVVGIGLTAIARPVSVALCAVPLRVPWRDQGFLAAAGLRGAVPIVLATIPLAERVDRAEELFNVVFVLVIVLTVVTGPALPRLAALLRVNVERARDVDVEAAPLERIAADLLQVHITEFSRLHGVEIGELRLPPGVSVSLIVRGDASFTPDLRSALKRGDDVLVVAPRALRDKTEERLQAISRGGRLGDWAIGP